MDYVKACAGKVNFIDMQMVPERKEIPGLKDGVGVRVDKTAKHT